MAPYQMGGNVPRCLQIEHRGSLARPAVLPNGVENGAAVISPLDEPVP